MQLLNVIKQTIDEYHHQPTATCQLTSQEVYTLLSSNRRRHTIQYLNEVERTVTVRELSQELAERDNADRQSVYITLIQGHLQKLAEKDVVDYNRSQKQVTPTHRCKILSQIDESSQQYLDESVSSTHG